MNENIQNLVAAMLAKDANGTQAAFQAAMAEKISDKLDDMRSVMAQNMFKQPETVVEEETISEGADEAHAFAKSMVAKHKGMKHEYDKENDVHVLHGHKRGDEVTNYIEIKHAGPGKVHYYHQSGGHYEVHKKDMSHEDAHKQITKAWKHGDVEDSK